MNFADALAAFRDPSLAKKLLWQIADEAEEGREYRFMEFCGGHTHVLARFGIKSLLPPNIAMVHGPGCPVCVLPVNRIDEAAWLAREAGVALCAYGDCLRVPGSSGSLFAARSAGADVRMVYSPRDVLKMAAAEPQRQFVFFGIGFETSTPPTAAALLEAQKLGLANFTVLCHHVLTPPAMRAILAAEGSQPAHLSGIVGPAHVSAIVGAKAYSGVVGDFHMPLAIAGFEPVDLLWAVLKLVRQANAGRAEIENAYGRAVSEEGNLKAQALMEEVFELRESFEWRGLGSIPQSARKIRPEFAAFDAEARFSPPLFPAADHPGCACGEVLRGLKEPRGCKLFGKACTPENPIGACMVSSEGACAASYLYEA
jgi:hydrogenase expression/formation protein HypD